MIHQGGMVSQMVVSCQGVRYIANENNVYGGQGFVQPVGAESSKVMLQPLGVGETPW